MAKPQTQSALLINQELDLTLHHFLRSEPVELILRDELANGEIRERAARAEAFVFACSETGAERRYGVQ